MERNEAMHASAVAGNFKKTLLLWGALPTSRAEERGPCVFVSTGTAIPDQNYAYSSGEEDAEENVLRSARFFTGQGMPFTWWFPPGTRGERFRRALEERGMPERCAPPRCSWRSTLPGIAPSFLRSAPSAGRSRPRRPENGRAPLSKGSARGRSIKTPFPHSARRSRRRLSPSRSGC